MCVLDSGNTTPAKTAVGARNFFVEQSREADRRQTRAMPGATSDAISSPFLRLAGPLPPTASEWPCPESGQFAVFFASAPRPLIFRNSPREQTSHVTTMRRHTAQQRRIRGGAFLPISDHSDHRTVRVTLMDQSPKLCCEETGTDMLIYDELLCSSALISSGARIDRLTMVHTGDAESLNYSVAIGVPERLMGKSFDRIVRSGLRINTVNVRPLLHFFDLIDWINRSILASMPDRNFRKRSRNT